MALSSIIRQQCPVCQKIAVESSRLKVGKSLIVRLACGHFLSSEVLSSSESVYESIVFNDGCRPRPYQIDAMKFAENANIRCIIADEQGLGKTIECLSLIRLHHEKLLPAVIVCPATVALQWMYEIHRICGNGKMDKRFLVQVIRSGKERAMPGFTIYVITYDLLKKDDMFEYLAPGTIKTIIIDECQKIKNHLSDRAKAVQRIAKDCQHVLPMSGTPIYNHAGEYFTVLNLVAPTRFPHHQKYIDNYVDSYEDGWATKYGGLKDKDKFHEDTSDIIIRRTKSEVLKDLPAKSRLFHHVELNRNLNKEYAAALKELEDLMYDDSGWGPGNPKIAIMSRMRHITGRSKVVECVDFATEFLLSTDRKLVIFTHHQDVMDMLQFKLNEWLADGGFPEKVLYLHSGLSGDDRTKLVTKFRENDNCRIMLSIFTEGLNLQFCSDAVILERQWTPTKEEQTEDRFHRYGQVNPVSITYFIASGTIDEGLTELVEIKRSRISATMDNVDVQWDQQSLMKELAELLVSRGQNAWRL